MPTPSRLVRTTAFKLTLVYLLVFAALSLGLIGYISATTSRLFDRQLEDEIDREIAQLDRVYRTFSLFQVMRTINRRGYRPGASVYHLTDFSGNPLAGNVSDLIFEPDLAAQADAFPVRYMRIRPSDEGGDVSHRALAKLVVLGGGYRLLVGRDVEDRIAFSTIIKQSIRYAIVVVVALALLSWLFLSRSVLRKVDAVAASSRQIVAGDLSRRLPVDQSGDEFDRLAESVNSMLDEINRLHAGLQEVSQNIAHDLKTPLTRVRNRLDETMRAPPHSPDELRAVLAAASDECDQLIRIFEALLTIARVESQSAGLTLSKTDLSALLADMAEFYEPAAEDVGMALELEIAPAVTIMGEPNLLRTMIANLIDNALKYGKASSPAADDTGDGGDDAPAGRVRLTLTQSDGTAHVTVRDYGKGVAAADRPRLSDRFVRMDASRSKPGAGLGLSMVKAIVGHHGGTLRLDDAAPGLAVKIDLPCPS
ncbi:MAG: HAMP domain-containing sensor histidine kinase [Pseudomonadota bacterium]